MFLTCCPRVIDSKQDGSSTDLWKSKLPLATGTTVLYEFGKLCSGNATSEDMDESVVVISNQPCYCIVNGQLGESIDRALMAQHDYDTWRFDVAFGCTFLDSSDRLHDIGLGRLLTCNKLLQILTKLFKNLITVQSFLEAYINFVGTKSCQEVDPSLLTFDPCLASCLLMRDYTVVRWFNSQDSLQHRWTWYGLCGIIINYCDLQCQLW